jgi:hypothetical protein
VIEGHRLAERPLAIIEWSLFGEVNTSFFVYYNCVACGREVQIVCSCIFVCRKLFHPGVCPARRQIVVEAEYMQMPIFESMFDKL